MNILLHTIHVADAALRAKHVSGLESAHVIKSSAKKQATLQLKMLRGTLKLDTTYVDRANTNHQIFDKHM